VVHFDLLSVSDDKTITIALPLVIEGTAPGVIQGGKLRQNYRKITVKALPNALPETISVNVNDLKIGDSIRLGEINIEGVTFVGDMRDVVVAVKTARGVVEEEVEAEAEGTEEGEGAEA
jgi:large subunit ribosomal protein L25